MEMPDSKAEARGQPTLDFSIALHSENFYCREVIGYPDHTVRQTDGSKEYTFESKQLISGGPRRCLLSSSSESNGDSSGSRGRAVVRHSSSPQAYWNNHLE